MSASREEVLHGARIYLRDNRELRRALDIADDIVLEPQFLGQGEHNENYWFEDPSSGKRFVLRINVLSQPFHKDQITYEYRALEALDSSGCTPHPLYKDTSRHLLPDSALVMSFCEGQQLDFDELRPGDLRCAAQLMADIHAVRFDESCPLHQPKDPLGDLYQECVDRFKFYYESSFEQARITKWMEYFINAARPALETECSSEDRSHIINTETLPSHFLIPSSSAQEAAEAGAGGRFCTHPGSMVDWERPIIGEPAQDLAWFLSPMTTYWDSSYIFPTEGVEAFLDDYWRAVDGRFASPSFYERFKAYRMVTALRTATWCCKALVRYGVKGNYQTMKTQEKLPIYLSDEIMELMARECF